MRKYKSSASSISLVPTGHTPHLERCHTTPPEQQPSTSLDRISPHHTSRGLIRRMPSSPISHVLHFMTDLRSPQIPSLQSRPRITDGPDMGSGLGKNELGYCKVMVLSRLSQTCCNVPSHAGLVGTREPLPTTTTIRSTVYLVQLLLNKT